MTCNKELRKFTVLSLDQETLSPEVISCLISETTCYCFPLEIMMFNCPLSTGYMTKCKQLKVKTKKELGCLLEKNVDFNDNEAMKLATKSLNLLLLLVGQSMLYFIYLYFIEQVRLILLRYRSDCFTYALFYLLVFYRIGQTNMYQSWCGYAYPVSAWENRKMMS